MTIRYFFQATWYS